MFTDGHVQKLEFNPNADSPGHCFDRCKVVVSMKKQRYSVQLCLSTVGAIKFGLCAFTVGLTGSCNRIAALAMLWRILFIEA